MKHPEIQVAEIVSMPFGENTFVVRLPDRSDCVVIDPGLEPDAIVAHLQTHELTPAAILNTHGHVDHIGGNATLKQQWPDCPLVIGTLEVAKLSDTVANLSQMLGETIISPEADVTVDEGDTHSAAGLDFRVLHVPGHSSGHVVYLWEGGGPLVAFVGAVIFAGSVGRPDFPGGSFTQLRDGIHNKLFALPDDTILLSGHGPETTVDREKRTNPLVGL